MGVNHENFMNFMIKEICIKNMPFMCLLNILAMNEHDWLKIGSTVPKDTVV